MKLNEAKEVLDKAGTFERDIRRVRFPTFSLSERSEKNDLVQLYTTGHIMNLIPNIDDVLKAALTEGHTKYATRKTEIETEAKKIESSYAQTLTRSAPNKA